MYANDKTYYSWGAGSIQVCVWGEPNLAGLCPVFQYSFVFDQDTDKLVSVFCSITNMREPN